MQRPKRRRLRPTALLSLSVAEREALATAVRYEGSPEHKRKPVAGHPPALRADATECPSDFIPGDTRPESWLREAVRKGWLGGLEEQGYPRYIWFTDSLGRAFEGRLSNAGAGVYKGYPVDPEQVPAEIRRSWQTGGSAHA